jgi:hypothetical protein
MVAIVFNKNITPIKVYRQCSVLSKTYTMFFKDLSLVYKRGSYIPKCNVFSGRREVLCISPSMVVNIQRMFDDLSMYPAAFQISISRNEVYFKYPAAFILPQPHLHTRTYAHTYPSTQRATQLRGVLARG